MTTQLQLINIIIMKFIKCPIAWEAETENTAALNDHQTPDFLYFNYKSFHSMNLLGVANTNCIFALTDVEAHGREDDSRVLSN